MIRLLYCGSSSACLELVNDLPFYAPGTYQVFLNGTFLFEKDTNVFSVYDLIPGTEYSVAARFQTTDRIVNLQFQTGKDSCIYSVASFGVKGDGITDDTDSIQTAIDFLPENGRLIFEPGVYLSRPLSLKSHLTLELKKGAVLKGFPDRNRYPVIPGEATDDQTGVTNIFSVFEGVPHDSYQSLITAINATDICITGEGTIDGNAQNSDFWTAFREFEPARPRLLSFVHCSGIVLHGFTGCNSPAWNLHPFHCRDVSILDVRVNAPKDSPNTDAIDPEACSGVRIIGCKLSVGDDCIAIKSGKIELAKRFAWPAEDHTVRNCLMENGHGAVTLGSESAMGIKNLMVTQCFFRSTDRGLRIKTRRGRGKDSNITGVVFDNIKMDGVLTPIVINMWYNCCDPDRYSEYVWSRECLPVDDRTPHLGSFRFTNMDCTGAQVAACYIDGLPEMPIDSVTFEDIRVVFDPDAKEGVPAMQNFAVKRRRLGFYLDNVNQIRLNRVSVGNVIGEPVIAAHYEDIAVSDLTEE